MLDLSFLTEEEQANILKVLQRDADLKKKDDERIRKVRGSIKDEKKKKCVTGEWFEEVKAQRYQDNVDGTELIHASVRRKKNKQETNTVQHVSSAPESLRAAQPHDTTSTSLTEAPGFEHPRFDTDHFEKRGPPKPLPKPIERPPLELPTLPPTQDQTETSLNTKGVSFNNTSPVDSGIGTSPPIPAGNLRLYDDNDDEIRSSSHQRLQTQLEQNIIQPDYSAFVETSSVSSQLPPDFLDNEAAIINGNVAELSWKSPQDTSVQVHSKIPVKKKLSSRSQTLEISLTDNAYDWQKTEPEQKHSSGGSGLPLLEEESGKVIKHGANFTIYSMKDRQKEEDVITDPTQFKNLKTFWETGVQTTTVDNDASAGTPKESLERPTSLELVRGYDSRLRRSISVQSDKFQTVDERPVSQIPLRKRISYSRAAVLSSSEDEPNYVVTPRRGPSCSTPRSSYRGATMAKSVSSIEFTGSEVVSEEHRNGHRSNRKSKLPVKSSSLPVLEKTKSLPTTPTKENVESIGSSEHDTPLDKKIIPQKREQVTESLQSRVRALLEDEHPVEIEDEICDTIMEDYMAKLSLKTNGAQYENVNDDLRHESVENKNFVPATDSEETNESAVMMALSRASSFSTAKSMVNIYTTTETYCKPPVIANEHLHTEMSKELSKSTPALLNESESDTASEISLQFVKHRKTPSNASHSSDMASVSSVSGSILSVYSGDFGSVDAQGSVQFGLDYNEKNREFQIYVAQCVDLATVDEKKGRTDPYVKTYLLPDKTRMGKRKTSVKKRTVNPTYNEILRYKIEKTALLIQKLNLSVWHNDPLGRNSFLGEIEVDLTSWDWSNRKLNWYSLKPRCLSAINGVDHRGMIYLCIKYIPPGTLGFRNPPTGEVHIWVKDCKDLPQLRLAGVDSFVKCYVLPDTSKKSYQKTRVIKKDQNPVFNHTIVYDGFHTEDLKDACVELTVWDHEKLTNHFLGGVRLGIGTGVSYGIPVEWMDSTQEEAALWQDMMSNPNEWIEGALALRSSLAGKKNLK